MTENDALFQVNFPFS